MTKRRKHRKGGGGSNDGAHLTNKFYNQGRQTVVTPFRAYYSQAVGASNPTISIMETPMQIANLGNRMVDLGDIYTQFRIKSLQLHSYCFNSLAATCSLIGQHGVAVIGTNTADYVTPTTMAQLADFPAFNVGNCIQSVNLVVPPSELYQATPSKWYNCSNASDNFSAGSITWFAQNGPSSTVVSLVQQVIVSGVAEFRLPMDPSLLPMSERISRTQNLLRRLKLENVLTEDYDSISTNDNNNANVNDVSSTKQHVVSRALKKCGNRNV
jgi:hypothetical protein